MDIAEYLCDTRPEDSEIARFEQSLGITLSLDYRTFLLTHNGGRPNPSSFSFTARRGTHEDSSVHYFYGLHSGRVGSLERQAVLRGQSIPSVFLPIATDPFGNLILIGTSNSNHGKIFFWDHELEEDMPSLSNISPVAPSFSAFTNALSDFHHAV